MLAGRGNVSVLINHVEGLKAQLEEWLNIMSEDPHFAPPAWGDGVNVDQVQPDVVVDFFKRGLNAR